MKRLVWLAFLGLAAGAPLAAQEIKPRTTIECEGSSRGGMAFSTDGKRIARGGREATRIWDVASGKVTAIFKNPGGDKRKRWAAEACSLAFSPDGKVLAAGSADPVAAEVRLWDLAVGKTTFTLKSLGWPRQPTESAYVARVFRSLAFSPDGTVLAAGGGDVCHGEVKLWDPATGKHLGDLDLPWSASSEGIASLAFSADGKLFALGGGRALMLFALATGAKPESLVGKAPNGPPRQRALSESDFECVSFSPDGKTLATAGWDRKIVELWDTGSGKRLATFHGHKGNVTHVAFLPDGKSLLSGGDDYDGTIRLWDVASGRNTATASVDTPDDKMNLLGCTLSPDGKTLATALSEKIKLWDVRAR